MASGQLSIACNYSRPVCRSPGQGRVDEVDRSGRARRRGGHWGARRAMASLGTAMEDAASSQAQLVFQQFMLKMKDPRAQALVTKTKEFISRFGEGRPPPGSQRADWDRQKMQGFLAWMEGAFKQSPVWRGCSEAELEQSAEGIEKYVTTKLYDVLFGNDPLDGERDVFILAKMQALKQALRPEHLDIPEAMRDENQLALAQKELLKIEQYKAPRDKLVCILNACKVVSDLCARANGRGADDLMPLLSYVTMKGAPQHLFANLSFIQRFRAERRLAFGEASYYFSTMCAVASFVETLNAEQLSMPREQFVQIMQQAGLAEDANAEPAAATDGALVEANLLGLATPPSDSSGLPWDARDGGAGEGVAGASAGGATRGPAEEAAQGAAGAAPVREDGVDARRTPAGEPPTGPGGRRPGLGVTADEQGRTTAGREPPGPPPPSLAELEEEGVRLVLQAEQAGALRTHRFLYSAVDDVTVGDVRELLALYKGLVIRHEALCRAVQRRSEAYAREASGGAT